MAAPRDSLIVIAYDGSDGARDAIRTVSSIAAQRRAVVVYAFRHIEALTAGMGMPVAIPPDAVDAMARHAREIAEEGAALAREAGLDAEPAAVEAPGRVADAIVHVARERGAAAIVVGSRGRGEVRS